jgi:hypothetical protein
MEHRCAVRKPLELDVVLSYRALGFVQGRTRDVSMGGAFVETGCIQLPVNAVVQASFILSQNNASVRSCSTEAMVVHGRENGSGLMFNDLDDEFSGMLKQLMSD